MVRKMCYTEEWYEEWCPTYFCCHHDLIMLHAICTNICISAWIGSTSARSPTLVSKLIISNEFEVFKEVHFVRSKDAPLECCIQQQSCGRILMHQNDHIFFFPSELSEVALQVSPTPCCPQPPWHSSGGWTGNIETLASFSAVPRTEYLTASL